MIYSLLPKCKYFFSGALIITHLVTCFLAPWFHQHSEQDHAEVKGSAYHSHVSPFASHAQEFDLDHHDLHVALHLLEGSQPFDKMQFPVQAHFGQIIAPGKFVPQGDFSDSPPASVLPPKFVVKSVLKFSPVRPTQHYFVLIAAGLSPPLA